ncbi:ArsR/SmtB family transcription factor [Vallitalea pronyensis]|nr:metalloregulator ArsR/SmtB family transcription factor [Vallitalea pronyensis]
MSIIKYSNTGGGLPMIIVNMFKSLSDENRLRIMNLLIRDELCVCEIEVILELSQSNVSRHLNKLKSDKMIDFHKKAQWVHYFASDYLKKDKANLYQLLQEETEKIPQCMEDVRRLNAYKDSHLTCESIRQDKEAVWEIIRK